MVSNTHTLRFLLTAALALMLSACSLQPLSEPVAEDGFDSYWQHDAGMSLDVGEHAPVIGALFSRAQRALEQGRDTVALTYLDQARQIQPNNVAVLYRQAWLSFLLHRDHAAKRLIAKAKRVAQTDEQRASLARLEREL